MKRKVTSVSMDESMKENITRAADQDSRQFMDEVRYLLSLGLKVRARELELRAQAIEEVSLRKAQAL